MAGLGGDLFALIWDHDEKEVKSLNGGGKSGSQVNRELYKEKGYEEIPERGPLAVNTVPGVVDGWWNLHQGYGKLEWSLLFEDAIHYAKSGFPVTEKVSSFIHQKADLLKEYPETRKIFFNDDQPIQAGNLLIQPDLAWSFEQISSKGRNAFYQGDIADKIIASLEKHDGVMIKEDFANHTVDWQAPISTNYRGYEVYQVKPNTQGIVVLMMLNMLEKYDMSSISDGTPEYYHLMAEIAKLKFRIRDEWVTDPETINIPYDDLLSKSFSTEINEHFSWDEVFRLQDLDELPEVKESRDTAYMSIVDKDGNSISLIQSIFHEFGSGFMPVGTGFFLQNRGSHFSLDPNHPNTLEPNKHTFHTIIPSMALKDGKPYMLFGSMGGEGQPQTQCAMLTRVIDFGYNIQQAIESPRWLYGKTWGADSSKLNLEGRIGSRIVNDLKKRGHEIEMVEDFSQTMGHAQGIIIDQERGIYSAGADPRGDGIALSW